MPAPVGAPATMRASILARIRRFKIGRLFTAKEFRDIATRGIDFDLLAKVVAH